MKHKSFLHIVYNKRIQLSFVFFSSDLNQRQYIILYKCIQSQRRCCTKYHTFKFTLFTRNSPNAALQPAHNQERLQSAYKLYIVLIYLFGGYYFKLAVKSITYRNGIRKHDQVADDLRELVTLSFEMAGSRRVWKRLVGEAKSNPEFEWSQTFE